MGLPASPISVPLLQARQLAFGFLGNLGRRNTQPPSNLHNGQEARSILASLVSPVLRTVQTGAIGGLLLAQAKALPSGAQDMTDDPVFGLR